MNITKMIENIRRKGFDMGFEAGKEDFNEKVEELSNLVTLLNNKADLITFRYSVLYGEYKRLRNIHSDMCRKYGIPDTFEDRDNI